jgi:hypothetical protein
MSARLQEIKKESTPFLIELPKELNVRLRQDKPKNLSLRRFIVVLLARLYNQNQG